MFRRYLYFSFFILHTSFIIAPSSAQSPHFRHLTTEDGLPTNQTNEVMKDSRGFIWIATRAGLCRYDGYTVKVYQHDPTDSTSISDNHIGAEYKHRMVEDKDGYLWIATLNGLNRFDPATEKFKRYFPDSLNPRSISNNEIFCLYVDKRGTLWAGTGFSGGLNRYDRTSDDFTVYCKNPGDTSWKMPGVLTMREDRSGVFWVGTSTGLYQFDRQKETFELVRPGPGYGFIPDHLLFNMIYEDRKGILYFGTFHGFLTIDSSNRTLIPSAPYFDMNAYLPRLDVLEDPSDWNHPLWIAAWDLWLHDRKSSQLSHILHDPDDPSGIRGNMLTSLFFDESGMLWITGEFGVNITDPSRNQIHEYPGFGREYGDAMSFLEDSEENLWIGTSKHLVHGIKGMDGTFLFDTVYLGLERGVFQGNIWALCEDRYHNIWAGTETEGLFVRERGKKDFVRCSFSGKPGYDPEFIWQVYEDSQGTLWIVTFPYGLFLRRAGEEPLTVAHYIDSINAVFTYSKIQSVFEDHIGNLWISTKLEGLFRQPTEFRGTCRFINYRYDPADKHSVSSDWIWAVNEDASNSVWIATENGLNRFINDKEIFERYSHHVDKSANTIYNLTCDRHGDIWMTTEYGLVRFIPGKNNSTNDINDPFKQILPFKDILPYCLYKNKEGRIYAGGSYKSQKGFFSFHPDSLRENRRIPPIVLTDFQVRNKPYTLDSSITHKKRIILAYQQNFFSFEFAALNFEEPEKNQYAFMLEGVDESWIYSGNQRKANYTGIPPGHYFFRVKASNNDGLWNETGASIGITILPPPWKTWWAYVLYTILTTGILILVFRFYLKRIQLSHHLEMERLEARKLKELDSMKSRFFANISHEFRTPLTLILGPVQNLFQKVSDESGRQDLNIIQRSALRLQRLINQLLELSRLESGKLELHPDEENIVALVKNYVQQFESLAKHKGITLEFCSESDDIPAVVDREKIEKILYNLLGNAFKFTNKGGKISLGLSGKREAGGEKQDIKEPPPASRLLPPDESYAEITISDTGVGIPQEKLPHIFDRFYQVNDSYTKDGEGTGIGLALTKELVELHGGMITAESTVNHGSTFRVFLPLMRGERRMERGERRKEVRISKEEVFEERSDIGNRQPTIDNQEPATRNAEPLVLIVEDNPDLRLYIRGILGQDYRILEAGSGRQGLEKALEHIPDLVLTDVMMQEMDGYELTRQLKNDERTSHIPVILLTARASMESKLEGLETGADDFISKPFDPQELIVRIKNLIGQRKMLQQKFSKKVRKLGLEHLTKMDEDISLSLDQRFLQKVTKYILHHLSDMELDVESIGAETFLSSRQLHRKMVALTGDTPGRFVRSVRLYRAAELLKNKTASITEIAYEVGFNNLSWFSKCFKEEFGVLPSEFSDV